YAVFVGRRAGVYLTWFATCDAQVHGVRHNSYKGYRSTVDAYGAFNIAQSRGLTFSCGDNVIRVAQVASRVRLDLGDLPLCMAFVDDEVGITMAERTSFWYVVYQGTQPGVYRTYHEVQLATTGIAGAQHGSFRERGDAIDAFTTALERGNVYKL
ncbi:hypothetical protein BD626DRAFT_359291, partial [Schizophyllum amplum]